ncbi:MAG TPA: glycosyltransferase [Pyrinomonadaceae bacterium]|jgi:glycosyltransferase involved in cell wall biosynthesis
MATETTTGATPLVSIGMPVYNGAAYLRGALDALLRQDYAHFELIISDDASTDETEAVCREYAARDARIRYHRQSKNLRAYRNFNYAFAQARGEFFMWAAQDDIWHASFISRSVAALQARPEAVLCHSQGQPISPDGQALWPPFLDCAAEQTDLRARWNYVTTHWELNPALYGLMRRETAARTRLLRLSLCADLIFIAELALYGQIIQLPETLYWKRRPVADEDYHTHAEMLAYVAGAGYRRPLLVRLAVMRELAAGLRHANLGAGARQQLARDLYRNYVTRRLWLVDLKEYAAEKLGRDGYRKWRRLKATLSGRKAVAG